MRAAASSPVSWDGPQRVCAFASLGTSPRRWANFRATWWRPRPTPRPKSSSNQRRELVRPPTSSTWRHSSTRSQPVSVRREQPALVSPRVGTGCPVSESMTRRSRLASSMSGNVGCTRTRIAGTRVLAILSAPSGKPWAKSRCDQRGKSPCDSRWVPGPRVGRSRASFVLRTRTPSILIQPRAKNQGSKGQDRTFWPWPMEFRAAITGRETRPVPS